MPPGRTRDGGNGIASFVVATGGKSLEDNWGEIEPNDGPPARHARPEAEGRCRRLRPGIHLKAGRAYADSGSASCL